MKLLWLIAHYRLVPTKLLASVILPIYKPRATTAVTTSSGKRMVWNSFVNYRTSAARGGRAEERPGSVGA
jgi:hypothetical protein